MATPESNQLGQEQKLEAESEVEQKCFGVSAKWLSLGCLTFHMTWQVFVVKAARQSSSNYLNSVVVVLAELCKIGLSVWLLAREQGCTIPSAIRSVISASRADGLETLKLGVPALAYAMMNNLIFFSLDRLSGAVQQVAYQLKILAAAFLSVVMLGKVVTCKQWLSLLLLVIGVALVQFPRGDSVVTTGSVSSGESVLGMAAVLAACFLSGFAGVFMERVLKDTSHSMWMRNVQLAVFGTMMSAIPLISTESTKILEGGPLQGFNIWVWLIVITLATGGVMVALVLKYANNVLRQFAGALSLIITTLISSVIVGDLILDPYVVIGISLAIFATFAYQGQLPSFLSALFGDGVFLDSKAASHSSTGRTSDRILLRSHVEGS